MSNICKARKQYDRAEDLLQKILAVVEKKLGANHPLTGKTLNSLGELYIAMGRYIQAESFCRRATQVLQDSLGLHNDHTAVAFNNLAKVCIEKEEYLEAQNLCQTAKQTLEKIFSEDHPTVIQVLSTMAIVRQKIQELPSVAKLDQGIEIPTKLASAAADSVQ